MEEVEGGAVLEAEEEIGDRGERRTLAGFVPAVKHVQPRTSRKRIA